MKITNKNDYPKCQHHDDCFAYFQGRCNCLTSTFFHGRDCPFYKRKVQNKEETTDFSE